MFIAEVPPQMIYIAIYQRALSGFLGSSVLDKASLKSGLRLWAGMKVPLKTPQYYLSLQSPHKKCVGPR